MRLILLVVVVLVVVGVVLLLVRRPTGPPSALDPREREELEASRDLIRELLADAVDVSDVDPVLAPRVIDRIRAHQRNLGA